MIPNPGCHPSINIVFIGAILIALLINFDDIDEVIIIAVNTLDVSYDHVLLSLDWLFLIGAINENFHVTTKRSDS